MDGISILLVEDNTDDADIIRRLVQRIGGENRLDIAATGQAAVEMARVRAFDVAVVDQHLPDARGEWLIGELNAAVPELPVVILTRQGDERLAVKVMKAGAYDYLRKDDLDSGVLNRTLFNVVERARLKAEIQRADERLREWAIRDGLTGLYNHRHFQELLRTEFARAVRYGQSLACLMVDLDHFKLVNDTYGHPFGDEVLKQIAHVLISEARKVDVVARYGGEEFVLLLPNTEISGARVVADRICAQVGQTTVTHDGVGVAVTLSVGVATSSDSRCTNEKTLVKLADSAMYQAKRSGRNRVYLAGEAPSGGGPDTLSLAPVNTAVRELEGEARRLYLSTLVALIHLADANDGFGDHAGRVARLAVSLGRELGLDTPELELLRTGALLHDIGRLAETEPLYIKMDRLTPAERARLPRHCLQGARIFAEIPALEREREIILHHHEAWDGTGYPEGLAREATPLLARIVGLCEAYDALTSSRPWRGPYGAPEAMRILDAERGQRFEPRLIDLLARTLRREDPDSPKDTPP